jgi:hypothetical protein
LVHLRAAITRDGSDQPNTLVFFDRKTICQALCYILLSVAHDNRGPHKSAKSAAVTLDTHLQAGEIIVQFMADKLSHN